MTGKLAPEVHTTAVHPNHRDDLDVHELDGEAVIVDPVNGALHRLDAAAWSIWQWCDGTHSVESIAKRFATCRGVGLDDAAAIVNETLDTFVAQELLQGGVDADSDSDESPPVESIVADSELNQPVLRILKQTGDAIDHAESVPANDNGRRSVAKLPYEPPVIETLYPSSTGLPPDVIDEWGGIKLHRSETDDRNQRSLHLARSKWGVARSREILRRAAVKLGLR